MKTTIVNWVVSIAVVTSVAACAATQGNAPAVTEPVPGTESADGVTLQQRVADATVVDRIATARCDREESCARIGTGALYRNREACERDAHAIVSRDISPDRCPGGVGEVALDRCIKSIELGACDRPGQEYGRTSHCQLSSLCMKR